MKTYIYPQNLKAKPHLWLWGMRDFVILALLVLLSAVLLVHSGLLAPMAGALCFAFVTIRMEDIEDVFAVMGEEDNWIPYLGDGNRLQVPVLDKISAEMTQLGFAVNDLYEAFAALLTTKFATGSELDGVGHTISTQAVSGVGAAGVGVAGSAAITIIHAVSSATIAGRDAVGDQPDMTAGGDIRVEANEAQKVYTTASASADKSLGMAAKAVTARKPGSSVGVGASFATNLIDAVVTAMIGTETVSGDSVTTLGNRVIRAGSLAILATFRDDVDTVSVAGSDPIARRDKAFEYVPTLGSATNKQLAQAASGGTNTKGISFDAGVAVAVVNNIVKAALLSGGSLETVNVLDTIESAIVTGQNAQGEDIFAMANVLVQALYGGDSYTGVSAFAAGSRAAVGAAVGVSLVSSDITASLEADTTAAGSVRVHSATDVTDESYAMATSIGADLDRLLEKFREGLNYISPGAAETSTIRNKIVAGTNKMGASKLQEKANQAGGSLGSKLDAVPYSSNLLKAFGLDLTKGTANTNGLNASVSGSGAQVAGVQPQTSSLNVAAAIALAFTEHHTLSRILGNVISRTGDVQTKAENVANFRNRATGATVTSGMGANTVAAAVAVTLNENTAEANVGGGVTLEAAKDVTVTADTTQNLTGNYPGYMSAQAVAASIATGMQGTLGVAGAVAVLTDKADTLALLGDNVIIKAGGDVFVTAKDLSKLAIRALGASIGAQTVGVGAAFAMLHSFSDIQAKIGDGLTVEANSLTVTADRPLVDESMYEFPFDWSDLLTISNQDATVGETDKGLMHITLPDDLAHIRQIKVECTIGTDDLLDLLDMINYLATVNYYVEAVSGSLHHGAPGAANVAGTVAQLLAENSVLASIGDGAALTLGKNEQGESLTVRADSSAEARVIAGSASLGTAKAGAGAVVSLAQLNDKSEARIGNGQADRAIHAAGDVTVAATARNLVWDVATADAVTGSALLTLGGGFNLVESSAAALASVGDGVTIHTEGAFAVDADNDFQLALIAANMGLAAGSTNVAVGGTVAWTDIRNETGARVGDNTVVKASSAALTADSAERVMEILASASGAPSGTANAAATLAYFATSSETMALAGSGTVLEAMAGDVLLHAFNDSDLLAAMLSLSASGSSTAAAGATVLVQQFSQKAHAGAGISENPAVAAQKATLIAHNGKVLVESRANNRSLAAGAALALSGSTTLDLAGTYVHNAFSSEAASCLGDNSKVQAWDSIGILADADNLVVSGAGAVAGTGSTTAALGGSATTVIFRNLVQALVGEHSDLTAWALDTGANAGIGTANRQDKRRGVVLHAFSAEEIYMAAVAGSVTGSSTANLVGVADTLLVQNTVNAHVGNNSRVSAGLNTAEKKDVNGDGQSDDSHGEGEIAVEARDDTFVVNFGGALDATGSAAAVLGGTVVTILFEKQVSAILMGGIQAVHAEKSITVDADSTDEMFLLAATFGVTGGTAAAGGAGNILAYENAVQAHLGGQITTGGDVNITADTVIELYNVALSIAGASTAGVSGVAVVTSFQGLTEAILLAGASVDAKGKLNILANSREFITADGAGISGGGTAGVSGTVVVILNENTVLAIVQDNAAAAKPVIRASSITLDAQDDYRLIGVAASASFGATAGAGVTAIVTLADNLLAAGIGSNYAVQTNAGDVLVNALSKRDVRTYAGSVGAGGTTGVGAVIMALVVGGKLDDDSAQALAEHFHPSDLLAGMKEKAPSEAGNVYDKYDEAWLDEALAGSGNSYSDVPVDNQYNGADQYVSEDFNKDYTVTQNSDGTVTAGEPGSGLTVTPVGEGNSDADKAFSVYEGFQDVVSAAFTRAFIGANTSVTSAGSITIQAKDQLNASLGTVAFGASGAVGAGVGMAVAIMNGSVEAWAGQDSLLRAGGNITIEAVAESPLLTGADLSQGDRDSMDYLNGQSDEFNLNDSTETGARAIVGSNGSDHSVGVSIIGGVASEANARMEGSSSAHILTTGSIVTTGQLALRNAARSWAKADIDDDSVDVTLVNATLLLTKAIAGGSFQALADTGSLSAGDVDIQNKYYAESYAASGPAGGVGVTLVSTDANRAAAETSANGDASVKVSGNASVTNSVNIQNIGYLLADALGRTRKVNVSGVSIAVTVVDAVLKAGQTAGAQFDGETQVGGAVNVNSEIVRTGGYGIATAQAGGSGGANVSLVGAGVNHVTAKSSTANTVFLQGAGTLSAGNVSVRAKSLTEAQAIAKSNVNVGLVLLGSLNAASTTHDKVDVLVDGILVNASGTFTAEAVGNTISDAVAASEGGGGLVTSGINTANAKVGGSETDPQTVRIIVRDSIIQAVRDITLRAYNTGNARANIERGLNVAAGNLSVSVLPTNAWYDTGVEVLEGSEVRSTEGNVSVLSEDAPKGRSEARGTSIGIGVNSNVTYGENTADTTNTIRIHGILDAGEALIVEAISSAQLNAATYADGGGFFEGTMLWSKNTLKRVVSILVEENSTLLANYGDLVISAEGGTRDSILTRSEVSSGGVVALGTATALVNIDSRVTVQIGENVLIRARFSQVDICADASQTGVATNVSADASGLGVAPNSTANVNTNLDADVIIGKTGGELAVIEGKDVEIIARNGEVDIYTYTYAKGSALGAAVNALSNPKTTLRADVRIDGADITGHDNLHIYASVKPAYRDANISVHAIIQLNAVGEALAKAGGATNALSNTILGSGVTLRGAVVAVTRYGFDQGRIRRDARKGGFIVKEAVASHSFDSGGTVSVSGDTVLYLGDAAGGIYIDISEHKGQLTVREVGVKNPDKFYEQNGNVITFSDISNNLPGMADFSHDGHDANGSILVYNQAVLPRVILTNSSHFDVQLNGIYVSNSGFIQPSVFGIRHTIKDVVYDKPEVRTEFSGTGGVKVSGFVSNTDGHVEFVWTGEEGGALTGVDGVANISSGTTVSPVWAHDLLVKGAASVGTADQAFNAYVFSGSNGVVNIEAYGDVFVNIVPVTLILVDENNQVLERHEDPVYIERVVSLSGNVKMDLKEAVQATMIVGTTTVTIPLPGSLSYITDATVELASAYTLTGKDVLDYYLQGYDASERLYRYLLPNGTLFYMDAWGNVSRIEEGGTETAVGDFEFIKDTSDKVVQIKLNEGISIDLSTGYLTVAEDASYEVLLEAISASWFTSQGLLSGGGEARIRLVTAGTVSGNQGENLTDEDTLKEMDVRVVLALSTAQIDYYYLSGLQPTMDAITGAPATTYYYFLLHDKGTDSLRFYAFTGGSTEIQNVDQVNRDSFNREHLQVYDGHPVTNTLNNGVTYYEAQFDSVARDTHEWRSGTHLGKVLRNASGDPFTVTDFLGTGYEVVWNSNNTMSIDGTAVGLVYIPGLGYTVAPGQNLSGQAAGLYQALAGIYWMPSVERTVESSVQVDGMTYTANGKDNGVDVFRFAEFVYTRLNNNKDKPTTQMYRTKTFCMYSYWLQFTYVKMQPVTASLSNEYYTSGVKYTGFDKTVYENTS